MWARSWFRKLCNRDRLLLMIGLWFVFELTFLAGFTESIFLVPDVESRLSANTRACCNPHNIYATRQVCPQGRADIKAAAKRRYDLQQAEANGSTADSSLPIPEFVDPAMAISPRRFDLAAKYVFADSWYRQMFAPWHTYLYIESIRAFNQFHERCSHRYSQDAYTFTHHDCQDKEGSQAFVDSFRSILTSVCRTGTHLSDVVLLTSFLSF